LEGCVAVAGNTGRGSIAVEISSTRLTQMFLSARAKAAFWGKCARATGNTGCGRIAVGISRASAAEEISALPVTARRYVGALAAWLACRSSNTVRVNCTGFALWAIPAGALTGKGAGTTGHTRRAWIIIRVRCANRAKKVVARTLAGLWDKAAFHTGNALSSGVAIIVGASCGAIKVATWAMGFFRDEMPGQTSHTRCAGIRVVVGAAGGARSTRTEVAGACLLGAIIAGNTAVLRVAVEIRLTGWTEKVGTWPG
jgi:hypothetical protein